MRPEREWSKAEDRARSWLKGEGCSEEAVETICASLKSHFEELFKVGKFHFPMKYPAGLSSEQEQEMKAIIADLAKRFQEHLSELAAEAIRIIGLLEIQLYEANHRKD
jgi:hypothetical protein